MKHFSLILLFALCAILMLAFTSCDMLGEQSSTTADDSTTSSSETTADDGAYDIKFCKPDGTLIYTAVSTAGASVTAPKYTDSKSIFIGWFTEKDGLGEPFDPSAYYSSDCTYYAYVRTEVILNFYVDFELIDTFSVKIGEAPGREVTPPDRSANRMVFDGWKNNAKPGGLYDPTAIVTKDTDYIGTYTQYYQVRFFEDGIEKKSAIVKEGDYISAPGNRTAGEGYVFEGWITSGGIKFDGDAPVSGEYDYIATFVRLYNVVFKDDAGTVLSTQTVKEGADATLPYQSQDYFYSFSPVDAYCNITADTTIIMTRVPASAYRYNPSGYLNYGNIGGLNYNGAIRQYAINLYEVGNYISYTGKVGGSFIMEYAPNAGVAEGVSFVLAVTIDGKLVNTVTVKGGDLRSYNFMCYVPADGNTHTVKVEVVDIPGSGGNTAAWLAVEMYFVIRYTK